MIPMDTRFEDSILGLSRGSRGGFCAKPFDAIELVLWEIVSW
jgi:hypothetical protein